MRYFTSDTHLFHRFVAELRGHGGRHEDATLEAHNSAIVRAWREQVTEEDEVYLLGDATVEGKASREGGLELLKTLPGRKHLIMGNHDPIFPGKKGAAQHWPAYLEVFSTINLHSTLTLPSGGRNLEVMLSHFPYSGKGTEVPGKENAYNQWRLRDEGAWLLHGHTHSSVKVTGPRQVHVGWDAWGKLVPQDELVALLEAEGAFGDLKHRAFLQALKRGVERPAS